MATEQVRQPRPRVVIVGGGFAGYHTARRLSRLAGEDVEIVLLNPTDYSLYLPLLPEVAAGLLDPRRVAVRLVSILPAVRLVLGQVDEVNLGNSTVHYSDPEGARATLGHDRLVLAVGSVNKLLPIPGVADHAHGFRGIPEALYLRDHITRQIELADATDDPAERAARCTFAVVGAGYTGTEVAAQGSLLTRALVGKHPRLAGQQIRWLLLDSAARVLPELDERLSRTANDVLSSRGVEIMTGCSVAEATADGIRLSDQSVVRLRTLVWCVGVEPDPLVQDVSLPTRKGQLVVEEYLQVPGHPEVFACGDAAAVPDLTRPGQVTPPTAQHAVRQGRAAAVNIAASLQHGERRPYRHRDLGFLVDLGGTQAIANPLHVPLSGVAAEAVTRAYHLVALPGNRIRTAAEWSLNAVLPRELSQLGVVRSPAVPLESTAPELPDGHGPA